MMFLFLLNLCLCLSGNAESLSDPNGVAPSRDQFRLAAVGDECGVFRALAGRAEREVAGTEQQIAEHLTDLQQRHDALAACAKARSVDLSAGEILAEVCPQAFQRWIVGGAAHRALREELEEIKLTYVAVERRLKRQCASLPAAETSNNDVSPSLEFF